MRRFARTVVDGGIATATTRARALARAGDTAPESRRAPLAPYPAAFARAAAQTCRGEPVERQPISQRVDFEREKGVGLTGVLASFELPLGGKRVQPALENLDSSLLELGTSSR